jgi:Ankyrin repeats (3 copies)
MSSHEQKKQGGASCPCKRLPLCLSSFTAAEHGNFQALLRHVDGNNNDSKTLTTSIADRQDAYGNTPLHLAAQHGHVAATAMLLQANCNVNAQASGATPLHRASFSGAVATMQLLLSHNSNNTNRKKEEQCDLLVQDSSFGDFMTPLHKAASGGRHLAVQLLLDAHAARRSLPQALKARDAMGATPLQVACQKNRNAAIERQSVARWDAVAGHTTADWEKCIQLLQQAQDQWCHADEFETVNKTTETLGNHHEINRIQKSKQQFPEIPFSLSSSSSRGAACLACPTTADKKCLTSSWESQFWAALSQSAEHQLCKKAMNDSSLLWSNHETNLVVVVDNTISTTDDQEDPNHDNYDQYALGNENNNIHDYQVAPDSSSNATLPSSSPSSSSLGRLCTSCQTKTFALYPSSTGGLLVCKKCQRKGRPRR